jgi:hypothetical protein
MRYALASALLLLTACATGGVGEPVVDAGMGTAPFALVSSGFVSGNPKYLSQTSTEEMTFVFRNVTETPQTAESLFISQLNETRSMFQVKRAVKRIDGVIAPGEELEVRVAATVERTPRGERGGMEMIELNVLLKADGTSYRYAPVRPTYPRV